MGMVYALVGAHFVGDFLCQSDWMALNKSKHWGALGAHVLVYAAPLMVALLFFRPLPNAALFLVVNVGAHFVQDAVTSRINARLWQANERHWFFVGIGADQLLHYVTLFATAQWWLEVA